MAIGAQLAAARRAAKLSLTDIHTATNIKVDVLAGIEAEDFERCRGDSYARGHIRAYARAVGLDADPLVREFAAGNTSTAPRAATVLPIPVREREVSSGAGRTIALATAVIALVLFLAWVVSGPSQAPASPLPSGQPSTTKLLTAPGATL